MQQVQMGQASGNGAAITIELGWTPDYVKVFNATDCDIYHEWFALMSNGTAMENKLLSFQKLTSNGITPVSNDSGGAKDGFIIGSSISEAAKQLQWIAMRSGPGNIPALSSL